MFFTARSRPMFRNLRRLQGGWTALIYFIVTLVLTVALSPKPPKPKPASLEDFDIPVAEEDRPIPVLFGTKRITGANVVWYGNLRTTKIKKSGLTGSTTIGYKYYLGMHLALGHGPFDAVTKIETADKTAWTGNITSNGNAVINMPDLYGGKQREGGIAGTARILFGRPDQTVDTYLAARQGAPTPAYRGVTSIVWSDGAGQGGYIGNTPYVKAWAVTCRRILKGWAGDAPWYSAKAAIGSGMNPAHIIYQCLTDPEWGQGSPSIAIDEPSFVAAADQLFTENFGLNMLWNQASTIEAFIQTVLDHIAGVLAFDESTGQYMLKLIRADYDPDTLETFGPETISEVTSFERRSWGETVNELAITFTDGTTGKPTAMVVQDLGNIRSQGVRIAERVDFSGIDDNDLMVVVAGRELAARSTPLARMDFKANRRLWRYGPGDVFKAFWPAYELPTTIFRVLQLGRGTHADGKMTVSVVEDIYGLPGIEYTASQPSAPPEDPPIDPDPQDGTPNVLNNSLSSPPGSPEDGDRYYVPTSPPATGAWAGHEGEVAEWDSDGNEWLFFPVPPGTVIFNEDDQDHFSVDEYGNIGPAPWTPAINPLPEVENTFPDLELLEIVVWDTSLSAYRKITADRVGGIDVLTDKGDLLTHTGVTNVRLPVGPDGALLLADSTESSGLRWATVGSGDGSIVYADASVPAGNTITNTTAETQFASQYSFDTLLLSLGAVIRGRIFGVFSTDASAAGTMRIRIKLAGTTIFDTTAFTITNAITNGGWSCEFALVITAVGGTGSVECQGVATFQSGATSTQFIHCKNTGVVSSVNLSTDALLTVTAQWGTADADNSIKLREILLFSETVEFIAPDNTKALLHFEGADASTTFTDQYGHTFSGSGSAQIDTAVFNSGAASLQLARATTDFVQCAHADFAMGTGDFCIEGWARWEGALTDNRAVFCWGNTNWCVYTFGGTLAVFDSVSSNPIIGSNVSLNTWYHIAITRQSGTLRLFRDGVLQGSAVANTTNWSTGEVIIGNFNTGTSSFNGHIDEVRVTIGEAVYTAAFTPPTPPFADP